MPRLRPIVDPSPAYALERLQDAVVLACAGLLPAARVALVDASEAGADTAVVRELGVLLCHDEVEREALEGVRQRVFGGR